MKPNLYVNAVKLYRRWVPTRLRNLVGALRGHSSSWSETHAEGGVWRFQDYTRKRWESEYRTEKWTYMRGLDELSRYSVVIGYARFLHPAGSILDLGCGEGILQQHLGRESYSRYVGVDVSRAAIDEARQRQDDRTQFVCSDVATFVPKTTFDVIVFNEVLYYLRDPIEVMRRYEAYLRPGGVFIVSMFANDATEQNWETLSRAYDFLDETRTGNTKSGLAWSCRVVQPPQRALSSAGPSEATPPSQRVENGLRSEA